MKVDIEVFRKLNDIAIRHSISSVKWAKDSDLAQSRIAELRKLAKERGSVPNVKTGRECTYEKIMSLVAGLKKVLGAEVVKKELLNAIKNEKNRSRKLFLMALVLGELSDEAQKQAESMWELIIKSESK
jgi:hypothetical protein